MNFPHSYELPRLSCGTLEGRVSLSDEKVEVVVNGPNEAAKAAFFFLEEILGIIDQVALVSFHNLQQADDSGVGGDVSRVANRQAHPEPNLPGKGGEEASLLLPKVRLQAISP